MTNIGSRRAVFGAALFFALAGALPAQEFRLGAKVSDFAVNDLSGKPVHFDELRGTVTVVGFVSTRCPVSNSYNGRMNAVYAEYAPKGVKFVFVDANANESADEVRSHFQQVGAAFPVYKDPNNAAADMFGAQATPEMFVIDSNGALRYHGYIDDAQNETRVRVRGLRDALDAVLAGRDVPAPETKAFGCSIKRVRKTS